MNRTTPSAPKTYSAHERPDIATTIAAMQVGDERVPSSTVYYGLSGLTRDEVTRAIAPIWVTLSVDYRRKLLRSMVEFSEADVALDYREIGLFGVTDTDGSVREAAVDVLWEDTSAEVLDLMIHLAVQDPHTLVRAAGTGALGRFILMGELGELDEINTKRAQQTAIQLYKDPAQDTLVRRRALEAIAHSSLPFVSKAIKEAYENADHDLRISAVYAMGKSCDTRWEDIILTEIDSDDPEMRFEAARAAGEIELQAAVPKLGQMLEDVDDEVQQAAVWSLGEIGGREATRLLTSLADALDEDDELLQIVEEALESASIAGGDWLPVFDNDAEFDEPDEYQSR